MSDTLDRIAEIVNESEYAVNVKPYHGRGDVEVYVKLPNPSWGLPADLHNRIRESEGHVDDFSHVNENGSIRLYLKPG